MEQYLRQLQKHHIPKLHEGQCYFIDVYIMIHVMFKLIDFTDI